LLACSTNRGAVRQLPRLTHQLGVPSLWIAGGRDQVMEPRYVRHLAGYSPMHQLELIEAAGHLPMCQMPRQVAALMDRWLETELGLDGRPPLGCRQGFGEPILRGG
jgi:pimeloyl-ACP methyl ester carboxylesterase